MREFQLTKRLNTGLERLNCRLGNHQSETNHGPARVILIGKASADMMGLKIEQKTYHIDVVLDLQATGTRLLQIRQCMAQGRVFREFDTAWSTFFGTTAHRDEVFEKSVKKGKCVFKMKHLRAYVMGHESALDFEDSLSKAPDSDRRTLGANTRIADALRAKPPNERQDHSSR